MSLIWDWKAYSVSLYLWMLSIGQTDMLDGLTFDQLRTFIAAADEKSFSAAGRKLGRAQSVVSQTLANLEAQLGLKLFDRSGRYPTLTEQGRALLDLARTVTGDVDLFKAHAKSLAEGLEPQLNVVVDVMFPIAALTDAVTGFHAEFPETPLRLEVEALGAVAQSVLDGSCELGIMAAVPLIPPEFTAEHLFPAKLIMTAAPTHPLAQVPPPIPQAELAKHLQMVLSDRSTLSRGRDYGVMSPRTWRVTDLGAKHAFIRAGLGWGSLPEHIARADLTSGALVQLALENATPGGLSVAMSAVYRADTPPGPAGRWFIDRLRAQANGKHKSS